MDSSQQSPQGLRFGIFEIDLDARELRKRGLRVKLQEQPFKILAVMVARAGQVIPREDLYAELSSHSTYDFKHGLNNAIQKIREVLGDSPENARFIETVPGRGYRFLAQVEVIYQSSTGDGNRAPVEEANGFNVAAEEPYPEAVVDSIPISNTSVIIPASETVPIGTGKRRQWWFGAVALALIIALPTSLYLLLHTNKDILIVVPFVNISGNPGQEYIADGMTEEMITQLSRLNPIQLGVIARTTSMIYKGTTKDTAQIGRELGVNYLLEGSIQLQGNRIRVTAQLIHTSDQTQLG